MNNIFPKTLIRSWGFLLVTVFVEIEIKICVVNICFLQKYYYLCIRKQLPLIELIGWDV